MNETPLHLCDPYHLGMTVTYSRWPHAAHMALQSEAPHRIMRGFEVKCHDTEKHCMS